METTLPDFLDPAVITRLGNLPLHARRPMLGNVSGRHRSPHRGSSIEFAEYRKYVPGDDPRRLDWRTYARSDRFYVKEYEADTNLRLVHVLDLSGSMRYGSGPDTKLQYARKCIASLSYLAAQQGDAVGLTCVAGSIVQRIPPRRSGAHLRHVFDQLKNVTARGETGLIEALHGVAEETPQRAMILIHSDLFIPPKDLAPALQHLRFRRHDIAIFHLWDRTEWEFPFERPTRFVDLEGGPSLLIEPSAIRREYAAARDAYVTDLDRAVRDSAVDYQRVSLEEPPGDVLARFLLGRLPRRSGR